MLIKPHALSWMYICGWITLSNGRNKDVFWIIQKIYGQNVGFWSTGVREWRRACLPCTCVQTKITCVQTKMKNFHQISYVFDQNWRFFFKSAIFSLWVYRREFNPASFPDPDDLCPRSWLPRIDNELNIL